MGRNAHVSKPQLNTKWSATAVHNSVHKNGIMSQSEN